MTQCPELGVCWGSRPVATSRPWGAVPALCDRRRAWGPRGPEQAACVRARRWGRAASPPASWPLHAAALPAGGAVLTGGLCFRPWVCGPVPI